MDLLFFLLLGHYLGDYALQTDKMAANKRSLNPLLFLHVAIYTLTIIICIGIHDLMYSPHILISSLPWMIPVYIIHLLQDVLKSRFFNGSRQMYYIDQALHLITLYGLRFIVGG